MAEKENSLLKNKHVLICLDEENHIINENLDYLKQNFCGIVLTEIENYHPQQKMI